MTMETDSRSSSSLQYLDRGGGESGVLRWAW